MPISGRSYLQAIALLALVSAAVLPSAASTWRAPIRPLTDDERMEFAASATQAVGIGVCSGLQDSLDSEGNWWHWMVFTPDRWLKGGPGTAKLRLFLPTTSSLTRKSAAKWINGTARCLVFMRHVESGQDGYWVVAEHPDFPGAGVLRLDATIGATSVAIENRAARAVSDNTLAGVARRSPLIIVGNVYPTTQRITFRGQTLKCPEVAIDSVVAGARPQGTLRVYTPYGGLPREGHMLLMLTPGEGGAFEVVGFESGAYDISNGEVTPLGQPLTAVVRSIRQSVAATGTREGE